jgi:DNA-binding response OmpR family regulator/anti-sigma regulatory factor (Ser/Thr protein kinase)
MSGSRILVVDDDRTHLRHLEAILIREGFEVRVAENGKIAMEILEVDPAYDTILLDRNMPEMNGLEVLKTLKGSDRWSGIPVVLQTSLGELDDVLEGLREGARYYLTKPLDPRIVLGVVRAALEEVNTRRYLWEEIEIAQSALSLMKYGRFIFRTFAQCQRLAPSLALACPNPKRVVVGLSELLVNALEHGNLGITYDEKSMLVENCQWHEEVERRQGLPENASKYVVVDFLCLSNCLRFRIRDMGNGFHWERYLQPDPKRMFDNHGRGILMAQWDAFDRITYKGIGNCVTVELDL